MYVLLYVNIDHQPCYIQGSIKEINNALHTIWTNGDIDADDWKMYDNWELLGIEDGALTPMSNVDCNTVPHFEVN